jgi:hypothetical protein
MRETVRSYETRTASRYSPPARLASIGRPLRLDEECPTLFRYPGPCGLAEWWGLDANTPSMRRLGPMRNPDLWMSESPLHSHAPGARYFGLIAVLQPLRFTPTRGEQADPPAGDSGVPIGAFVADNSDLQAEELVWVPPSRLTAELPWDSLANADEAQEALGRVDDEQAAVIAQLQAYRGELAGMQAAGAPGPHGPWCAVPQAVRLEQLDRFGVRAAWSLAH